jgi:hypothetical protein
MPTRDGKHAYTDEEKAEIIAHVLVNVACGRFASRIFREDDLTSNGISLPNPQTFWRWVLEDESLPENAPDKLYLANKLTRAREHGIEALLDEVVDIADNKALDSYRDDEGNERPNTEWITRSRIRIDTRLKLAQMLKPKKYGAKLDLTSCGEKIGAVQALEEARLRARQVADEKYAGRDGE